MFRLAVRSPTVVRVRAAPIGLLIVSSASVASGRHRGERVWAGWFFPTGQVYCGDWWLKRECHACFGKRPHVRRPRPSFVRYHSRWSRSNQFLRERQRQKWPKWTDAFILPWFSTPGTTQL